MAKKLYRAPEDEHMIGGVCAGIDDYFDIDPTLVRLAFLLIVLARGAGVFAYLIAWIIIPERPANEGNHISYDERKENDEKNGDDEKKNKEMRKEEDSQNENMSETQVVEKDDSKEKRKLLGLILVSIGGIFLIDIWMPHFYWSKVWPLLVIALGVYIIFNNKK